MFYTESITIGKKKISFWDRVIKTFEKIGVARANRELQRLGYTKEYLDAIYGKNSID